MKTTKTMTNVQMTWAYNRGYAWENPSNDGGISDEFITREHVYQWEPPHIGRDGEVVSGRWVAID